jgi:hypothetical protein
MPVDEPGGNAGSASKIMLGRPKSGHAAFAVGPTVEADAGEGQSKVDNSVLGRRSGSELRRDFEVQHSGAEVGESSRQVPRSVLDDIVHP